MGLNTGTSCYKTRLCSACLHEIVLLNNDQDFSWDMHQQEDYHRKRRQLLIPKNNTMDGKNVKFWFVSNDKLLERINTIELSAKKQSNNKERNSKVLKAVEETFSKIFPGHFKVIPFGSRVTGLTTKDTSDFDIYINISESDDKIVDSIELGKLYLRNLENYISEHDPNSWVHMRSILTCRTPILKVMHFDTKMQCDITLCSSFGISNTQLMSLYLKKIPQLRRVILLARDWAAECDLINDHNNMNNYALSMLVLFYFQQKGYAPDVHSFTFYNKGPIKTINGYDQINYDNVEYDWTKVESAANMELKELLRGLFAYYAAFDFKTFVVCPLLGKPINKNLFNKVKKLPPEMYSYIMNLKNRRELFKINEKAMNIQDPLDLAHNLTKNASDHFLGDFIDYCVASRNALDAMK